MHYIAKDRFESKVDIYPIQVLRSAAKDRVERKVPNAANPTNGFYSI